MTSGGGGGGKIRFETVQPYPTYQEVRRPQTSTQEFWMAEEYIGTSLTSGVPRNFVRGGGFNKFSWGQREQGSGGGNPLFMGSGGSFNLVQGI